MNSGEPTTYAESGVRFPKSRSFPGLLSGFFLNHNLWSTTDHSRLPTPNTAGDGNWNDYRGSSTSVAVRLSSPFEVDNLNWLDSTPDFVGITASTLRRSQTSTDSLQKLNEFSHNAPLPSVNTSGGSDRPVTLHRSMSDSFSPAEGGASDAFRRHASVDAIGGEDSLGCQMGRPIQISVPGGDGEDRKVHSPKSRSAFRHHHLAAVPESYSNQEHDGGPAQLGTFCGTGSLTRSEVANDENQNVVVVPSTPHHPPVLSNQSRLSEESNLAASETTSSSSCGHVMHEAGAISGWRPRKLGILDFLISGERRKVRNKDVNLIAPQSW